MARNTIAGLLNVTRDTPSRGVAHRQGTRSMRQSPTQQGRRGNGVVRARTLTRHVQPGAALAADAATPLAILGGLARWLLRLALALLPPWPGSAPGCWPSAPSPPAAAPRHLGQRRRRPRGR